MQSLKLKDKDIFDRYLRWRPAQLSAVSFVNIFVWRDFFDFNWEIIENTLCLFAENSVGCFLYLPPTGKRFSKAAVKRSFEIMDSKNKDKNISRIENIALADCKFYRQLGLKTVLKGQDYLYLRHSLVSLSGNRYKSKRAAVNYFQKNYRYQYLPFRKQDASECLKLYRQWQRERSQRYNDRIYQQMLADSLLAQKTAMENLQKLDLIGRVVKIKDKICAYTFGFKLNQKTFCILFEIADLTIKGLANFIFREFCREVSGFTYINCMDDSGLENLKQTKLSFRPGKLIPAYIAIRN